MADILETEAKAERLIFDGVEIDTAGRRFFVDGRETPLEPKAFDVLLHLVERAGRVCARDELLDAVWGHRHITPGVLSRIITLLRQALGEHGDEPHYLHTVHGIGYRFDAEVRVMAQPHPREKGGSIEIEGSPLDVRQNLGNVPVAATVSAEPNHDDSGTTNSTTVTRKTLHHAEFVLLLLLAVFAVVGWKLWPQTRTAAAVDTASTAEQRSIAVLPMALASGNENAEQSLLSEGLSENLITTLSQFEGLKVIGRSSSSRFRDSKEDSKSIGAKLGVTHLIEGSVQRVGDDVRISIQLVRAADGSIVWTQRFDRPYKDLFALQDEISLAVAGALQVRLLHAMPGAVTPGRPASGNLAAYNAYLRATHYMGGGKDMRKAIEQFAEATRIDPNYAQAWSWLGFLRTQNARFNLEGEAASAAYAQARKDIETALKLVPDFGQAHGTFGNLLSTADHDWSGAMVELRKAVQLAPDNDPVHGALSRLLATLGKVKEAIDERRKYISGDPLSGFSYIYLAQLQASLGRLDEADASLRKAMEVEPDNAGWLASERSNLAILRGNADAALAEAMREPPGRWRDRAATLALQIGNDHAAADTALQRLIETDGQSKGGAYAIARVYALRGDADRTFEWLQRDWDRRDAGVHDVLFDPLLLRFRDDPRFIEYCKTTRLPPSSEIEALGLDQIRALNGVKL